MLVADELQQVVADNQSYIKLMASVDELSILRAGGDKPENAMAAVTKGIEVYLPLKGLIDVEKETQRLNKELDGMTKEIGRIEGKLNNAGFLAKAPAEVVEKEKTKAQEIAVKMQTIQERLTYLKNLE